MIQPFFSEYNYFQLRLTHLVPPRHFTRLRNLEKKRENVCEFRSRKNKITRVDRGKGGGSNRGGLDTPWCHWVVPCEALRRLSHLMPVVHATLLAFSAGCRESTDDERRMRGTVVPLRRLAVPSTLGDFQRARLS